VTRIHVPEDHFVHHGALLSLAEASSFLRPGHYAVVGRRGDGPVAELMLVVGIGRAKLELPPTGVARLVPS
jgi:hypothetical protein